MASLQAQQGNHDQGEPARTSPHHCSPPISDSPLDWPSPKLPCTTSLSSRSLSTSALEIFNMSAHNLSGDRSFSECRPGSKSARQLTARLIEVGMPGLKQTP